MFRLSGKLFGTLLLGLLFCAGIYLVRDAVSCRLDGGSLLAGIVLLLFFLFTSILMGSGGYLAVKDRCCAGVRDFIGALGNRPFAAVRQFVALAVVGQPGIIAVGGRLLFNDRFLLIITGFHRVPLKNDLLKRGCSKSHLSIRKPFMKRIGRRILIQPGQALASEACFLRKHFSCSRSLTKLMLPKPFSTKTFSSAPFVPSFIRPKAF
ncbi:Uncharacterised protein [Paenibacillus macerans]|uniref:Uncharacterized protein n=1 Tax=Paenibacillus macerans TaxID=44252 RepID=A0A090YS96_PAEMA|nr:hypothetical protein DJ90_5888 [Paenibacillus macerans]SUD26067.1 Uncharacterised protein [Paenibacillus macerans]